MKNCHLLSENVKKFNGEIEMAAMEISYPNTEVPAISDGKISVELGGKALIAVTLQISWQRDHNKL